MLPSSRIFRSRWFALFWAGGVLWTAYDVAASRRGDPAANAAAPGGSGESDALGETVNDADLQALANAMGG